VFYTAREFWPVRRRVWGGSAAMEIFRDARTGRVEPQGESNERPKMFGVCGPDVWASDAASAAAARSARCGAI
jgi:hypothetical protein